MSERDLLKIAEKFKEKLSKIKVFLSDVDGVLTDGKIFYASSEVGFNRSFHAFDGYGFKMLQKAGLKVGIITGGNSLGVVQRSDYLGLDYAFIGNEDKREAYRQVLEDGFKDEEILYIGDELFDIPLLRRAGFAASVPEAGMEVKEVSDYITFKNAGNGCVREVVDIVRYAKNIIPRIPDFD